MSNPTRRDVLKHATYVVPAVLTLSATPRYAAAGSSSHSGRRYSGKGKGAKGKGGPKWGKRHEK